MRKIVTLVIGDLNASRRVMFVATMKEGDWYVNPAAIQRALARHRS
jgi:hypothetical protein